MWCSNKKTGCSRLLKC